MKKILIVVVGLLILSVACSTISLCDCPMCQMQTGNVPTEYIQMPTKEFPNASPTNEVIPDPHSVNSSLGDPLVALSLLAESISKRNFEGIRPLIGDSGVAITGYIYEWNPPGYNNTEGVIDFLRAALNGAQPQCVTYILDSKSEPPRATAVYSGFNLIFRFGKESVNSLLIFSLWRDSEKYELKVIGPLWSETESKTIPGERVSCSATSEKYPGLDEFSLSLQNAIFGGIENYLADPIYLHPIGCIGECSSPPVVSLSGFVSPDKGAEYILACWERLEEIKEQSDYITSFTFDSTPSQDEWISSQSPVDKTLFYIGWFLYYSDGERAFPKLLLGIGEQNEEYEVTEAYCYPFVQ